MFGAGRFEVVAGVYVIVATVRGLLEARGGDDVGEEEVSKQEVWPIVGEGGEGVVGCEAEVGEEGCPGDVLVRRRIASESRNVHFELILCEFARIWSCGMSKEREVGKSMMVDVFELQQRSSECFTQDELYFTSSFAPS